MDQFSITDRLESTTPVRNPGSGSSSRGDTQPRQRKPPVPKPEASEETPQPQENSEATDDQNPHHIDELA